MPSQKLSKRDPHGLSPRERSFVLHYCTHWEGTRAAEEAGYSAKTAHVQSSDLLSRPRIVAAIEAEQAKQTDKLAHRKDRIRAELDCIGFADISELYDENGSLLSIKKMPAHVRRAIQSIKPTDYGFEVKLWDKPGTLKLAAQLDGLLVEKHEMKVEGKLEHLLALAAKVREQRRKALSGGEGRAA